MEIYVLNSSRETLGIIDDANSVIWTKRYFEAGDFEIYCRATTDHMNLLKVGNYVTRTDNDMVGIIESVILTTDDESGSFLDVRGKDASSLLGRRIVWGQTILTGKAENAVRKLVSDAVISPTNTARKIPGFILATAQGYTETIEKQITGDNLLDSISEICQTYSYGFKVTLNDAKNLVFGLYKGTDRSVEQLNVPSVTFGSDFDNMASSQYEWNESAYRNVALVAGEGEGIARKMTSVGNFSGVDRHEMFVDARNVSSNDGEITEADYIQQLYQQGKEKLAEKTIVESFSGEIITGDLYSYAKDFFVGDIVTVQNEYGITANVRITAVTESEDENGYKVIPTFDNWRVE